ncbi:hypothetical protein BT96DRAFT_991873 [Gymnopus androsaceus JB14]|uniref:Uncharacterized protein n=1 Tax=Gymnopus androsaceus JB14 TaxID=1447944 RepID=A0A6A4HXN6_9AGAR|nr:hypothetical protein BT96DRAFT_991871 [Gymnopus androsaceus JB14]KAE9401709.1 hypothetical protein BT96DRAFT_991873 [Gymnopus androsaceus JB14]
MAGVIDLGSLDLHPLILQIWFICGDLLGSSSNTIEALSRVIQIPRRLDCRNCEVQQQKLRPNVKHITSHAQEIQALQRKIEKTLDEFAAFKDAQKERFSCPICLRLAINPRVKRKSPKNSLWWPRMTVCKFKGPLKVSGIHRTPTKSSESFSTSDPQFRSTTAEWTDVHSDHHGCQCSGCHTIRPIREHQRAEAQFRTHISPSYMAEELDTESDSDRYPSTGSNTDLGSSSPPYPLHATMKASLEMTGAYDEEDRLFHPPYSAQRYQRSPSPDIYTPTLPARSPFHSNYGSQRYYEISINAAHNSPSTETCSPTLSTFHSTPNLDRRSKVALDGGDHINSRLHAGRNEAKSMTSPAPP